MIYIESPERKPQFNNVNEDQDSNFAEIRTIEGGGGYESGEGEGKDNASKANEGVKNLGANLGKEEHSTSPINCINLDRTK